MMKKKMWMIAGSIMLSLAMAACNGGKSETAKTDTDVENVIADTEQTEQEKSSEDTGAEVETTEAEEQNEAEEDEKINLSNYDYIIYSYDDDSPLVGFNIPEGYSINHIDADVSFYSSFILEKDKEFYGLDIDSKGYRVTADNKLVGTWSGYTRDRDITVEKKATVDTIFGPAEIYCATEEETAWDGASYTDYDDVALLAVSDNVIKITYSHYGAEEYMGVLETLLPSMFSEKQESEKADFQQLHNNFVQVNDSDYDYVLCTEQDSQTGVFGFNLPKDWNQDSANGINDYFVYVGFCDTDYNEKLNFSTGEIIFKHYYEENNGYGSDQYGTILAKEEKGSFSTPFGEAAIYYVQSDKDGTTYEEEIAVLNNNGANIVIRYSNNELYDGEYDGHLEELLGQIFAE